MNAIEMITAQISNTVNGVATDDLSNTINAIKATPSIAKFKFRIRNQWVEAGQNKSTADTYYGAGEERSRPKPFVLEADEPPVLLGKDSAANPVEHLLHALASCLTTSMVYQAAARGIHIEEVESTLEGDLDLQGFLKLDKKVRNGYQGIRVNFKIKADVPDEKLQEIGQLGPAHSPVYDSLTNGVPVWWDHAGAFVTRVLPSGNLLRCKGAHWSIQRLSDNSTIRVLGGVGMVTNHHDLQFRTGNHDHLVGAYVPRDHVDLSAYGITVTYARLMARYQIGEHVQGWSIGLAVSF
jgi:uncharacterized OsmC-like protein